MAPKNPEATQRFPGQRYERPLAGVENFFEVVEVGDNMEETAVAWKYTTEEFQWKVSEDPALAMREAKHTGVELRMTQRADDSKPHVAMMSFWQQVGHDLRATKSPAKPAEVAQAGALVKAN
eukprot:gnl/TRDRNA2_/TRDRNA2_184521_c0_seq1.p1 gnl/TRDRNA2_/TRDRNA2_184521_c0~~gnl/TRDRNA2_/TRDRNA2_184521_c0_seq1.p1  ORF type:complete len:122 (+),score=27.79 gnl/TRDRNA2_/TRDRNA2_184521_c0_seq1:67-432(+)